MNLIMSGRSLYLRAFVWLWGANPARLDICKLFWGTILAPLAFFSFHKKLLGVARLAWLYGALAIICTLGSAYGAALVWGILTLFVAGVGQLIRNNKPRSNPFDDGKLAMAADWVSEKIFDPALNTAYAIQDSKVGEKLRGFTSVARAYYRAWKSRTCVRIQII